MLVLSRRENEKVFFPFSGRHLGRCFKEEEMFDLGLRLLLKSKSFEANWISIKKQNRCVMRHRRTTCNASSMQPISQSTLAQNQLRQGLTDNAEHALEQAKNCLEELEVSLRDFANCLPDNLARETAPGYSIARSIRALIGYDSQPAETDQHRLELETRLASLDCSVELVPSMELVNRILQNDYDIIFYRCTMDFDSLHSLDSHEGSTESSLLSPLRIQGVKGLQNCGEFVTDKVTTCYWHSGDSRTVQICKQLSPSTA